MAAVRFIHHPFIEGLEAIGQLAVLMLRRGFACFSKNGQEYIDARNKPLL